MDKEDFVRSEKVHKVENLWFDHPKGILLLRVNDKDYKFELSKISERLKKANQKERETYEIHESGYGIHWPLIDEDLSIDGLLGIKHDLPDFLKERAPK